MNKKPFISAFNFLEKQEKEFKKSIEEANKIAIIGVNVNLKDNHIWDPIKNKDIPICYCHKASQTSICPINRMALLIKYS